MDIFKDWNKMVK